jgi:hypothetical protein
VLLASCVNTDIDALDTGLPCATSTSAQAAAAALVWIRVDLGDSGYRYCSAVAISPSLVLTAHSCVAYPSELDDAPLAVPAELSPFDNVTYFDPTDFDRFCDPAASVAVEDGSFRSRLAGTVPEAAIGVGLMNQPVRPSIRVDKLITAPASSRCNDGVAALLIADELDVPFVPIRFEPRSRVGEPVTLSGSVDEGGRLVRRDISTQVERVTLERGDELTPARALLLPVGTCYSDRGGAVFAADTGALVGIVAWTGGVSCEDGASQASVAMQVSSYRALVLEAAATYGQAIYAEATSDTSGGERCELQSP